MAVNEHDGPLDAADARIAQLYRQAAREDAPAHLDAKLMAAARQAVAPRGAPPKIPWWLAWRLPFAFAAVVVLSVSLVTLVLDTGGERLTQEERPSLAVAPQSPAAAAPGTGSEPPPIVADPAPAARDTRARAQSAGPGEPGAAAVPPAPPADAFGAEQEGRADARFAMRDSDRVAQKPAAAARATAADELAAAPAAPTAEAPRAAAASRGKVESQARVAEEAPPARSAAPVARPENALRRQEMGALAARERVSPEVERLIAELEGRGPGAWVERIAGLRRERRGPEADALIAEFSRRFPNEALPPALR
jgi:hypothetical protein